MLSDVASRLSGLEPERELDQATRLGIRFVMPGDDEWPAQLRDLDHCGQVQERGGAPVGLWVKGPVRLDQQQDSVAVVGARSATTYGSDVASAIAAEVAAAGLSVVSGAAFGIDVAAHRGAPPPAARRSRSSRAGWTASTPRPTDSFSSTWPNTGPWSPSWRRGLRPPGTASWPATG